MAGWRFFAHRLNGDGTETPLERQLELGGATVTEDLSGPGEIAGTISPETSRLRGQDGRLIFLPQSTAIYAQKDGQIRGGAILQGFTEDGPQLTLRTAGWTSHLDGQPYTGDMGPTQGVHAEPIDLGRHIWEHRQGKAGGNIGLELDYTTTSPVRLGTPLPADGNATADEGPYRLAWWDNVDLGREFDDLASRTSFDYRVVHEWDGDQIRHRLIFGYPSLGRRREDLRFVVGENVFMEPTLTTEGEDYASEVIVLGAGEGPKMIRSTIPARTTNRLHRTVVLEDKSLQTVEAANRRAEEELRYRNGESTIDTITVLDHPNAALGSYQVGDEIPLQTGHGWSGRQTIWVRILTATINTVDDTTDLDVERVERI